MSEEKLREIFDTLAAAFLNRGGDRKLVERLRKELEQEFKNAILD